MADNRVLTKTKPAKVSSWVFRYAVKLATVLTVLAVCLIIGYILVMGIPQIKPEMFELEYNSNNVSFMPALFNTLIVIVMAVSCSSIFGIGAAIFLNEYTNKTNLFVRIVALATETLSGIPSIVYGLFGLLFFVYYLQWGLSLLAGVCTMAIMTFPIIMRASQECVHRKRPWRQYPICIVKDRLAWALVAFVPYLKSCCLLLFRVFWVALFWLLVVQ